MQGWSVFKQGHWFCSLEQWHYEIIYYWSIRGSWIWQRAYVLGMFLVFTIVTIAFALWACTACALGATGSIEAGFSIGLQLFSGHNSRVYPQLVWQVQSVAAIVIKVQVWVWGKVRHSQALRPQALYIHVCFILNQLTRLWRFIRHITHNRH